MGDRSFVVMKFGGTSVDGRERWGTIENAVREVLDENKRPVVVCSALAGVTDSLERLLKATLGGDYKAALEILRSRHADFAKDLGVTPGDASEAILDDLERLVHGAALVEEVSPRLRARVMSAGELLSTRIGARFLESQGLKVKWADARALLDAVSSDDVPEAYLSAAVRADRDDKLIAEFGADNIDIVITQGFIAGRSDGHTALLGRGGSDTSAAVFAARLGADRCEIWTDVPGVFTANPRDIPSARLLTGLDYDEAQEIATTGAKVLHPRCIGPVREANIPLAVRCTLDPSIEGTRVHALANQGGARLKAISARRGITLVSMDTLGMWQQVGFLSDAFACFKKHGVSVDLVSTSETNVTASIDTGAQGLGDNRVQTLLEELSTFCSARAIGPCAAVSLVGRNVRSILHKLGPALALFEEQRIHLVSQSANDLNLTFVIDEDQEVRLVRDLHAQLFKGPFKGDALVGKTWKELFEPDDTAKVADVLHPWWRDSAGRLLDEATRGTPVYAYNGPRLDEAGKSLTSLESVSRVFFAIKANPHPHVLRRLEATGVGFECVSPGELARVFETFPDLSPQRVLFTPNFASPEEYLAAFERGVYVNVDNIEVLEQAPEVFKGRSFLLRVDPGQGRGHHAHVRTAGAQSKFGIVPEELARAKDIIDGLGAKVVGLHAHAGSGIRQPDTWRETALFLLREAERFPEAKILDLGGGLGVVEKAGQAPLDLEALDASLREIKAAHADYELWLEPGRFLVAEAGVLLCRVTQTKEKEDVRYVGVDAGMHTLVRPALYGAFHEIVNLSRLDEPLTTSANIVGPICETGDTLGYDRVIPQTGPGDVLLVGTAGAYGASMSSDYNLRPRAREVVLG